MKAWIHTDRFAPPHDAADRMTAAAALKRLSVREQRTWWAPDAVLNEGQASRGNALEGFGGRPCSSGLPGLPAGPRHAPGLRRCAAALSTEAVQQSASCRCMVWLRVGGGSETCRIEDDDVGEKAGGECPRS